MWALNSEVVVAGEPAAGGEHDDGRGRRGTRSVRLRGQRRPLAVTPAHTRRRRRTPSRPRATSPTTSRSAGTTSVPQRWSRGQRHGGTVAPPPRPVTTIRGSDRSRCVVRTPADGSGASSDRAGGRRLLGSSPLAVGVVVWLASELMFFGGLFAAYYTLRGRRTPTGRRRASSSTRAAGARLHRRAAGVERHDAPQPSRPPTPATGGGRCAGCS